MNGSQHYTKAETLLDFADGLAEDDPGLPLMFAEAQVHATLALAAAQADQVVSDALSHPNWVNASAWEVAIQHVPAEGEPF